MPGLQVGDRVRVVKDYEGHPSGSTGKVVALTYDGLRMIVVELDEAFWKYSWMDFCLGDGHYWAFDKKCLRSFPSSPFQRSVRAWIDAELGHGAS